MLFLAALASTVLAAAAAQFPNGPAALHSPDGTWQITDHDPVGNEASHRLILRRRDGPERTLYSYGRHVLVAWSPDSKRIAITDHSESTYAGCFVIDARSLASINVTEQTKRTSKRVAHIMGNEHSYFECLAWTPDRDLRVRARGYGAADPNGATVVTTYRLAAPSAVAQVASVGPSPAQLASAISRWGHVKEAPPLRHVRCRGFEEEPTEFECTYEQQDRRGHWTKWQCYVAIDGKEGWGLIDDPGRVPHPRPSGT